MIGAIVAVGLALTCGGLAAGTLNKNRDWLHAEEVWFLGLFIAYLLLLLVSYVVAEAQAFSGLALALGMTVPTGLIAVAAWRRGWKHPTLPKPGTWLVVASLAVVVAGAATCGASEQILGGQDPGGYVAMAGNLSRLGSPHDESTAIAQLDPDVTRALIQRRDSGTDTKTILPGTYLDDPATGRIAHQFLHGFPAFLAVGSLLAGTWGMLRITVVSGLLAVFALFLLGRRATQSPAIAGLAALFLAVNLGQIYFARNPFTEVPTQAIFLGAAWLTTMAIERDDAVLGAVSAVCWSAALLLRLDAYLAIPPLVLIGAWISGGGTSRWFSRGFLPWVTLGTLVAVSASCAFAWPYYVRPHLGVVRPTWIIVAVSLAASMALLASWKIESIASLWERIYAKHRPIVIAFAVVLVGVTVWGVFLRPLGEPPISTAPSGHFLHGARTFNERTFLRLVWYLSPVGLVLATAGVVGLFHDALSRRRHTVLPWLGVGLAFSVLYLWRQHASPMHFWAFRRYIPAVLPFLALAMAWPLAALLARRWPARTASVLLAIVLCFYSLRTSLAFVQTPEMDGAIRQVTEIAERLPSNAVLLTRPNLKRVLVPLRSLHGVDAVPLASADPPAPQLRTALDVWGAADRPVIVALSSDSDMIWPLETHTLVPSGSAHLDVPRSHQTLHERPRGFQPLRQSIVFARVTPVDDAPNRTSWARVGFYSGFHGLETTDVGTFRWTRGEGRIIVEGSPLPAEIHVELGHLRPNPDPEIAATVSVNGTHHVILPGPALASYPVPIPAGTTRADVRIASDTFVPMDFGLSDSRTLGLAVGNIRVEEQSLSPAGDPIPLTPPTEVPAHRLRPYTSAGLYTAEQSAHGSFAWTAEVCSLRFPLNEIPESCTLTLTLGNLRPDDAPVPDVEIAVGAAPPITRRIDAERLDVEVPLSGLDPDGQLRVTLTTTPWVPAHAGVSGDKRNLGIAVWQIRICDRQ